MRIITAISIPNPDGISIHNMIVSTRVMNSVTIYVGGGGGGLKTCEIFIFTEKRGVDTVFSGMPG